MAARPSTSVSVPWDNRSLAPSDPLRQSQCREAVPTVECPEQIVTSRTSKEIWFAGGPCEDGISSMKRIVVNVLCVRNAACDQRQGSNRLANATTTRVWRRKGTIV